jgi:hypothetical protein
MFSSWLEARAARNTDLEMVFVRRFTPTTDKPSMSG